MLRLVRSCLIIATLIPLAAFANLSELTVTFSPDAESFDDGETVSVQLVTNDTATSPEYRFVIQQYNESADPPAYEDMLDSGWGTTDQYSLGSQLSGAAAGNYRLVAYAREADNPGEFILNYQTFFFGATSGSQGTCEYLDGKTFINESEAQALSLTVGTASPIDSLQSLVLPFDDKAKGYSSLSFSGNTFEGTIGKDGTISDAGGADWSASGPLTGNYACGAGSVDVTDDGSTTTIVTSNCGGTLAFLGCPDGEATTEGSATVDQQADTITAGDVTFVLESSATANAPTCGAGGDGSTTGSTTTGGSSGGNGSLGGALLAMLVALGAVRRRTG